MYSSNTFTAPSTGVYQLNCGVNLATDLSFTGVGALAMLVNGTFDAVNSKRGNQFLVAGYNNTDYVMSSLFYLTAGDYVQVYFYQNSGVTIAVQYYDGAGSTWFNGFLVRV